MEKIAPYYKAVTGVIVGFLTSIGQALTAGSDGGTSITSGEWIASVIQALILGGAVFAVPNKDPEGEHQAQSVQPPEVGHF